MRRLSQTVKNRLFSRGADSGDHQESPPPQPQPQPQQQQRLSLPKIDLDRLGVYEEEEEDDSDSWTFRRDSQTDTGSGRGDGSGRTDTSRTDTSRTDSSRSERAPSPAYQQRRLLERRSSTPTPVPLSPSVASSELDYEQPHASCGKNTPRVVKQIHRLLRQSESSLSGDREGHVYILHGARDGNQPYYKLRFSRAILTDSDVSPLQKVCKIAVSRCELAEKLIVLLLDSMHILRYPLDDDPGAYHTYHKKTRQLIPDAMHKMATGKPRLLTKPETDWVMVTPEVLERVIQQAVLIVDKLAPLN